jgi:uncharacterized protein (TIGR02284 family)
MNNQEESINTLNELIEVCHHSNEGYKMAANHIHANEVKTILYRLSQQRALFEAELKEDLRELGADIDETPQSFEGTLRKAWANLKAKVSQSDAKSIIEHCKTNEEYTIGKYEEALKKDLPEYIKEHVNGQFQLIKGAYLQLNEFEQNPN